MTKVEASKKAAQFLSSFQNFWNTYTQRDRERFDTKARAFLNEVFPDCDFFGSSLDEVLSI